MTDNVEKYDAAIGTIRNVLTEHAHAKFLSDEEMKEIAAEILVRLANQNLIRGVR